MGGILDASLSVEAQAPTTVKLAFYQLRLIRKLVHYFTAQILATMAHAMVTSRLDECNELQPVQNPDLEADSTVFEEMDSLANR